MSGNQQTTASGLRTVNEVVLRRRKQRQSNDRQQKAAAMLKKKKKKSVNPAAKFKRIEEYVKEYRSTEKSEKRVTRVLRNVNPRKGMKNEGELVLIVRTKGIDDAGPSVKKTLKELDLHTMHTAVFRKMDKALFKRLQMVEPYVKHGTPALKTVKDLMFKRGKAEVDGKVTTLSDNRVIEEKLGSHGVVCMEDMVKEIHNVGKAFGPVTRFLVPLKMDPPQGGFKQISSHWDATMDAGEDEIEAPIDRLVSKMN